MKAIIQRRYGGPETLEYGEAPVPVPKANEVLIRVRAASVNAADWLLMHGEPYLVRLAFGLRAPKSATPGRDAAGVIEAVGEAVRDFAVGDEVYGEVGAGTFAEFAVAPARLLARRPQSLSFEEAACVPLAGVTALQGLRDVGKVGPGDRVLINGSSGGVGSFAVQLAAAFGATVTAVCSTRNVELVRSLGAHHVIDYTERDFTAEEGTYDVIFDLVGNHPLSRLRRVLAPRGTLVLSSGNGGRMLGPIGSILAATLQNGFVSQNLRPLVATANAADLDELSALIDAGKVRPHIERSYPLSETAEALRHFGEQHARGKIGVVVG